MNLIDGNTDGKLEGAIEKVTNKEFRKLKNNKNFTFDWNQESKYQVFKIRAVDLKEILGLISIIDYPNEFRIHINLIEASILYRGKEKSILNIPGCLIAFVCKLAFKKGYNGFVSLIPKTQLIKYYQQNYGFLQFGTHMAIFEEDAELLIKKYLGDE